MPNPAVLQRSGAAEGATWCARGPLPARRPPLPHGAGGPQRPLAVAWCATLHVALAHNASRRVFRSARELGVGRLRPRDSSRQPGPGSRQGGATRQGHTSGLAAAVGPQEGLPAVPVCPETGRVPRAVGGDAH